MVKATSEWIDQMELAERGGKPIRDALDEMERFAGRHPTQFRLEARDFAPQVRVVATWEPR